MVQILEEAMIQAEMVVKIVVKAILEITKNRTMVRITLMEKKHEEIIHIIH